jgi:hypothetical protein
MSGESSFASRAPNAALAAWRLEVYLVCPYWTKALFFAQRLSRSELVVRPGRALRRTEETRPLLGSLRALVDRIEKDRAGA